MLDTLSMRAMYVPLLITGEAIVRTKDKSGNPLLQYQYEFRADDGRVIHFMCYNDFKESLEFKWE